MECKSGFIRNESRRRSELIETLWNVNTVATGTFADYSTELIETLWNVNETYTIKMYYKNFELIETLWNVNKYKGKSKSLVDAN